MSSKTVKEVEEKVRVHFDDDAERFDAIYQKEKGIVTCDPKEKSQSQSGQWILSDKPKSCD